jgi:hypothetical protein
MAINLASLHGKLAKVTVEYMGQKALVQYDPQILTSQWMADVQRGDEEFSKGFSQLVKSWDVQSAPGKKIPITLNGLKSVPLPLLRAVYNEIVFGATTEATDQGKVSSDG